MKNFSLLVWVTQFGFSAVFPLCASLLLASWLRQEYDLGAWVSIVLGILGALTTVSTVRSCLRSLRKEAQRAGSEKVPPAAYNEHD